MAEAVQLANLGDIQLGYRWINEEHNGPVILFLHEGLGSIGQWKDFPETLCQRVGLPGLMYERQGYGNSSPLSAKRDENYLHDYALNELPRFLQKVCPNRELILYGHSDGGSIAYIYAPKFPDMIRGILTEAAHVFVEDVTLEGILPVVKLFEKGVLDGLINYHGDKTRELFYTWSDTWHLKRFRKWNIEADLSQITCPVLAIQGQDDEYGTEAQLDSIVSKCAGRSEKLFLPGCRHIPHKQQREKVLDSASEFIRSLLP